ncbi:DUF3810 domain-containing protein [Nonlabens sp. SCSIO 43208]|uniref:DUF3810 domain-containing protein n=1 Tax=Nonlabens sp. SCSIO 43208 TaxID=2793009 RepID=UPI003D6A634B
MKVKAKILLYSVILVGQFMVFFGLKYANNFIEVYYSNGIYPFIADAMRIGLGWIPFSFGDFIYLLLILLLIKWIIKLITKILYFIKDKNSVNNSILKGTIGKQVAKILITLNVIIFYFHMAWGFNYYRLPMHEILEIEEDYSTEQLLEVTKDFIELSNNLHESIQDNDSLKVDFGNDQMVWMNMAPMAFENYHLNNTRIKYSNVSLKKSLLTVPLTYMGYSGYLNPLTGEAQINGWINAYKTPVLCLHEMAHQLGFAKENEANFIAIDAGLKHPDRHFQYSASLYALKFCLNDLYLRDPEKYAVVAKEIKPGIFKNYQELRDFWKPYQDGLVEKVSHSVYDSYLKVNNQPKGIDTYNYVVALLVNYY